MKPIALQSQRFWLLKRKVNEPVKPFKAGKVSKRSKIDEDPRKSHSPIRLETSVDTESEPGNATATRFYNASPKFKDMPKRSSSVSKILPEPFQALMQDKAMKSSLVKKGQKFSPYKAKRNQPGSVSTMHKNASLDRILKEATLDLTKVTSVIRGQKSQLQMRED